MEQPCNLANSVISCQYIPETVGLSSICVILLLTCSISFMEDIAYFTLCRMEPESYSKSLISPTFM